MLWADEKKVGNDWYKTVRDLKNVPDPNTFDLPTGLSKKTSVVVWGKAQVAPDDNLPPPIDHRAHHEGECKGNGWYKTLGRLVHIPRRADINDCKRKPAVDVRKRICKKMDSSIWRSLLQLTGTRKEIWWQTHRQLRGVHAVGCTPK